MTLTTPDVFGDLLTNILAAIIILLAGFVVGKLLGSALHKVLVAVFADKKIKGKRKNRSSFALGFADFVSICVYIVAVIMALEQLGITLIVLKAILFFALFIILGSVVAVLVDFAANMYFGFNILTSGKFRRSDLIKIQNIEGTVKKIGLAHTTLITKENDVFILPNRMFFRSKFSIEKKN